MQKWSYAALAIAFVLSAWIVLREPVAHAAQSIAATIVAPVDGQGNVAVHEQGTVTTAPRVATPHYLQLLHGSSYCGPPAYNCPPFSFPVVYASTIVIDQTLFPMARIVLKNDGVIAFRLHTQPDRPTVVSLPEAVAIDEADIEDCSGTGSDSCVVRMTIVGT
jgi:hypothetical protein